MTYKSIFKTSLVVFLSLFISNTNAQEMEYLEKQGEKWVVNKEKYVEFWNNHPYNNRPFMDKKAIKDLPKYDRPDLAFEYEWLITHDPKTGKIPRHVLIPELQRLHNGVSSIQTLAPGGSTTNTWTERGPNNVGGRTRAIMFDPKDATNKKVWAGGVGGGLWYNNDITSSSSQWNSVNDFWTNIAVSSLAYDPTADTIFYCGTGEGWSNVDAQRGAGIWQSTNAGQTWSQLSSTNNSSFRQVQKIIVSTTGRVIAVTNGGIYTSDNDGATFTRRRGGFHADVEQAANGDLFATSGKIFSSGKIYKSTNDGTSWTDITPTGGSPQRIELACAPSDSNTIYAVASANPNTAGSSDVAWFKKSTNGGSTWTNVTIPSYLLNTSNHFTRGQAWYDLILWVHPTDKDVVIAGGVDLHRTTNGGTSWSGISVWTRFGSTPIVHADQHNIISRPGNNNEVVFTNDGGVYYSSNAGDKLNNSPTFTNIETGYNTTQFYAGAIHPTAGSNYMLAGAQDNGSIKINSTGIASGTEVTGGDGAFCFIDQDNANYQITSYIRNNWYRSTNGGSSFSSIQRVSDGSFINPADYDDNKNILYSAKSTTQLNRITNITGTSVSTGNITITGMNSMATHIRVSPHTSATTTLFVGSGGDVFKVTNADGNSPTATKITPTTFPSGSISCVEVGASENELLVTFSNYGVTSVWYTSNGGTNWTNVEGNLPNMPVRWALFNPKNRKEVIIGTELGVYATTDISASPVVWTSSTRGMAITRVTQLHYRSSDSLIMATTHGRGVFTGRFVTPAAPPTGRPVVNFGADKTTICAGQSVTFSDSSTNSPTSLLWTFTGGTPSTSTSSTPTITYNTTGTFNVKLKATNANGSDSLTKSAFIQVNSAPNVTLSSFAILCTNSGMDSLRGGSPTGGTYYINNTPASIINPSMLGAGTFTIKYKVTQGSCADSATQTLTINAAPSVSATTPAATCDNSPAITLSNGTPSGGIYSGTGVSAGNFDPSVSGAGTFSIGYKVTSTNGCSDSTNFNMVVNAKPSVALASAGPFCTGGTPITLNNGTPTGGTYSGTGVTGGQFDPSAAGIGNHTIKYVFTNSDNCIDSANTSVRVDSGAVATLSPFGSVCADSSAFMLTGGLPAGGTYSGPGVTAGMFNPAVAGAGTHSIIYTARSSCGTSNAVQSIRVDSVPNVTVTKTVSNCEGRTFQFNATGASSYSWSPGAGLSDSTIGNPLLSITQNATYILTGSNGTRCNSKDTITVTAFPRPTVVANNDLSVCIGDTFQLSATGALIYKWLPSTGLNSDSIANPTGVLSSSAQYVVVGTDANGCAGIDSVRVGVKPKSTVTHNSIADVCVSSAPITLTGGTPAGGIYSGLGVSGGKFDPSVVGLGTHTISYSAAETGKCTTTITVSVTVLQSPNVVWNVPNSICESDAPLTLTSTPSGGIYSGTGVTGNTFDPKVAGLGFYELKYEVTASGCLATEKREIEVVPGSEVDSIKGLTNVVKGGKYNYQVNPKNGAGYTWNVTGGNLLSNANNVAAIKWGTGNSGKIVLIQTNSFGCVDSTELVIEINALSAGDEIALGSGIVLYPNPADKSVRLKIEEKHISEMNVQLLDASGKVVYRKSIEELNEGEFEINTVDYPAGLYLLNIQVDQTNHSATLIIKH